MRHTRRDPVFIGVDLAWGAGTAHRAANETGVAVIDGAGCVLDAGWTVGVAATVEWLAAIDGPAVMAVDAPLVVDNPSGQRTCEREVGQRYGRWKVSANSTNMASRNQAGVVLRRHLEDAGWSYDDGLRPLGGGRTLFECYPYATLVGADELGYDLERPTYKRKPKALPTGDWRSIRAAACDDLVRRLLALRDADPPVDLISHATTRSLVEEPSPLVDREYKHREDLIDAVICAWTASFWRRHSRSRCHVLGTPTGEIGEGVTATIICPMRGSGAPLASTTPSTSPRW